MPRKLLVFSSILPKNTSAGEVLLHRHLKGLHDWDVKVLCPSVSAQDLEFNHIDLPIKKSWDRLRKTPFKKLAESYIELTGRIPFKRVYKIVAEQKPDIILTVAHGEFFWPALKISQKLGIKVVTIQHDWYPDMVSLPSFVQSKVARRFQILAKQSDANLCVCQGLLDQLERPNNATVLFPIPEHVSSLGNKLLDNKNLSVAYAGNLKYPYGDMLYSLIQEHNKNDSLITLELAGNEPLWLQNAAEHERAYYHGFLSDEDFRNYLAKQDILLVVMSFAKEDKRRMETSFPSKMIQYCQFEKPLLIWGPEYCSAVQWAKKYQAAEYVTDTDPKAIISKLQNLTSPQLKVLEQSARTMASSVFCPTTLQNQFEAVLDSVIISKDRS